VLDQTVELLLRRVHQRIDAPVLDRLVHLALSLGEHEHAAEWAAVYSLA